MIDVKWTRRNNLFIISPLAEAQRAVDMLTRLSGKADRRMWMRVGGGLGGQGGTEFINLLPSVNQVKNLDSYLAHYERERCMKLFGFPTHNL